MLNEVKKSIKFLKILLLLHFWSFKEILKLKNKLKFNNKYILLMETLKFKIVKNPQKI